LAVFAIPRALEAGETIERMKTLNPALTVLARAHSEGEVRHLLQHGADGAVLAERELAFSLAEMVMSTPPYRPVRKVADDDAAPPRDPAPAAAGTRDARCRLASPTQCHRHGSLHADRLPDRRGHVRRERRADLPRCADRLVGAARPRATG